jgi:hypothetical protein
VARHRIRRLSVLLVWLAGAGLASAQNVTEWSTESRIALAFRVNPEAVQRLLPAGWVAVPSTAPAMPGANLTLTMMERVIVLDPQGRPKGTGTSRYMVLGVPSRNTQSGQTNTIIVGGLSPEGAGAYGVYKTATTARLERTVSGSGEEQSRVRESWEFASASGEHVALDVSYRRGPATKAHVDAIVRSAIRPDFQRTYRIDQATDLVRGAGVQDRVDRLAFSATGPVFAGMFDGSETLLGVTVIPFYVREIAIP